MTALLELTDEQIDDLFAESSVDSGELALFIRRVRATFVETPDESVERRHVEGMIAFSRSADAEGRGGAHLGSSRWAAEARPAPWRPFGASFAFQLAVALLVAAALCSGLAMTGNLPAPMQRVAAKVAERFGITLEVPQERNERGVDKSGGSNSAQSRNGAVYDDGGSSGASNSTGNNRDGGASGPRTHGNDEPTTNEASEAHRRGSRFASEKPHPPPGKPEGRVSGKPDAQGPPAGKPEGPPAGKPEGPPAGKPEGPPAGKPEGPPTNPQTAGTGKPNDNGKDKPKDKNGNDKPNEKAKGASAGKPKDDPEDSADDEPKDKPSASEDKSKGKDKDSGEDKPDPPP